MPIIALLRGPCCSTYNADFYGYLTRLILSTVCNTCAKKPAGQLEFAVGGYWRRPETLMFGGLSQKAKDFNLLAISINADVTLFTQINHLGQALVPREELISVAVLGN